MHKPAVFPVYLQAISTFCWCFAADNVPRETTLSNTQAMDKEKLIKNLRTIPNFPIQGILFYDVTTLLQNPETLKIVSDSLYEQFKDQGITKVVGIESRGFIMGALLAERLGAGFVPIRKPGKLPAETIEESYNKEYGKDTIQMHKGVIGKEDIVLLHDDLLATGGTMLAAIKLVKQEMPKKIATSFIIELKELGGRELIEEAEAEVKSLLQF